MNQTAIGQAIPGFFALQKTEHLDLLGLRNNIVITMKALSVTLRQIGNSYGVVIPKPLLSQMDFGGVVEISIEGDALVLRKVAKPPRAGWASAAKKVAEHGDDGLVMGEFANEEDPNLRW